MDDSFHIYIIGRAIVFLGLEPDLRLCWFRESSSRGRRFLGIPVDGDVRILIRRAELLNEISHRRSKQNVPHFSLPPSPVVGG